MQIKYLIDTNQIAYVSNIIESYEDVSLMSTLKKVENRSLILFRIADDFVDTFNKIVESLRNESINIEKEV
jgi:Mg2+ and Co2+ transporter CorA